MVFCIPGNAQEKYEHERRINVEQVPKSALQFIESVSEGQKVKWFEETSQVGTSIESKFKLEGYRYSIEFSTTGEIQDLEIQIQDSELNQDVFQRIQIELDSLFTKYKILKIQTHFNGPEEKLLQVKQGKPVPAGLNKGFELVVKGKNHVEMQLYEIYFDDQGSLVNSSKIILNPTDNLVY
jgi:hypothetical protein